MHDIEILTLMDRALIEQGIIDPGFTEECIPIHESMRHFRSETGRNFSTGDLQNGERYLRQWLKQVHDKGASEAKLITMLRCGLGHLCYDFVEFTYEMIHPEDIVGKAIASFKSRNYHTAVFMPPAAAGSGNRPSRPAPRKKPAPGKNRGGKSSVRRKKPSPKK